MIGDLGILFLVIAAIGLLFWVGGWFGDWFDRRDARRRNRPR